MKTAAAKYAKPQRLGLAPRFVVFVALLAFALQSYFAQTHIHGVPQAPAGIVKADTDGGVPSQGKAPLNSPVDCPFCQSATLAGVFVAPAALFLYLPMAWIEAVTSILTARPASSIAAHSWQSRAPPHR